MSSSSLQRPVAVLTAILVALLLSPALRGQQPAAEAHPADHDHDHEHEHRIDLEKSFEIPHQEENHPSHSPCVVFTADGERMVTATSEGEIIEFNAKTRKISRRIKLPDDVTDVISIDPRARIAVAALAEGLIVVDLQRGEVIHTDKEARAQAIAVSPDGTLVAVTQGSAWEIRELPTLKLRKSIAGFESPWTNVTWSADGSLLAATAENGQLVVHHVLDDRVIYETRKEGALHAVAFHPAGKQIAYGGHDRKVYEYSITSEEEQVVSSEQPYWITCLGYSPDGEILAVGDESCDIWLFDRAQRKLLFHNKHHVECWLSGVGWAPDNETFLFGCRPNSHAGKPAVYQPLVAAEAAQAPEVCKHRDQLIQQIDERLQNTADEQQRKVLEQTRATLVAQNERTNFAGQLQGVQQQQADVNQLPAAGQFAAPQQQLQLASGNDNSPVPENQLLQQVEFVPFGIQVDALPSELQETARAYQVTLEKELQRLNKNHCINQWRLKRGDK